jgi:hypothetical protein
MKITIMLLGLFKHYLSKASERKGEKKKENPSKRRSKSLDHHPFLSHFDIVLTQNLL